ncbi:hypothetical protein Trco_003965 [Trichoderma cornu-damae]|uniref:Apple domain-containing protein n=1 Tax=Trichoderma cornu-damae TaxID=654480 RepID=A0A9P8QS68_9HYPO|nr:hypothetical protein Trco_003965 [Trichoderma cornu-damae]
MRSSLAGASALLLWASGAAGGAILAADGNGIVAPVQNYRSNNGVQFAVETGFDRHGGDYKKLAANSFRDCINVCSTQAACRAVSYPGKTCWLKSSVNAATINSRVSGAVRVQDEPAPITCPAAGSSQVKAADGRSFAIQCGVDHPTAISRPSGQQIKETSGRTFTVSCSADRPGGDLTNKLLAEFGNCVAWCDENGKQVKEPSGRSFTIACNVDRPGGDLASKSLDNFSSCIAWCDQTKGCVAAAYHDGQCWLKKTLSTSSARANGQVAVLSSKLPQTSAHTASTSTKKTTSTIVKTTSPSIKMTTTSSTTQKTTSTTVKSPSTSAGVSINTQSTQIFTSVTAAATSSATPTSSSSTDSASTATTASSESTAAETSTNAASTPATASDGSTSAAEAPTSVSDISTQSAAPVTTGAPAPNGTLDAPTGPLTLSAQPRVTLTPLAPPNIDVAGTQVITSQQVSQLWFRNASLASNASDAISSPTVRVNMTFEYPSVVLDNSINISKVRWDSGSLSASFDGTEAYDAAKTSWASAEAEGNSTTLIIITAAPGCSSDSHYVYFVASHFTFDDATRSVSCSGSMESVSDIAQEADPELAAKYGCTAPSAANIRGLPAVYCGPDFDQRLDNQLGYCSVADEDLDATLAAVIPGVQDDDILERRGLIERRCWPSSLCKLASKVEKFATNTYHAVVHDAKSLGSTLGSIATTLGKDVISSAKNFAKTVLATVENVAGGLLAAATFLVTASALDDSPWGDGFKFYTWTPDKGDFWNAQDEAIDKIKSVIIGEADPEPSIELWCVDCNIKGDLKLVGSASFSFYLGLNAFAEWDPTREYDFLTMGLPELEIPNILVLGPVISLGVSVDLDISAVGQYLIGADLNWSQLSATLDVLNPRGSSQSGWVPTVHDTVQADGGLTVNSTLGLPITLGFGINILNGKYDKEIKVVDTPGVRASMECDLTNEINNGSVNTDPEDSCYGIHWSLGLVNTVKLDLSDFDQGTYRLEEWDAPVFASGCIGESLSIALPTATVTAPTGGSTSGPPQQDCSSLSCPGSHGDYCVSNGLSFQLNCQVVYQASLERFSKAGGPDECTTACVPTTPATNSAVWAFTKVASPQMKRDTIVERVTTVATSATTVTTSTASSKANAVVADTLSVTSSTATTATAADTASQTYASATNTAEAGHDIAPVTIFDSTPTLTNGTSFMADYTTPIVVGDSANRVLYYFPSTISAVGASRLRLATWDAIPIGAEIVMLFPTVASTGETVLIAMDSTQNAFFPFVCAIEGQLNKIFLVSDAENGTATLTDPDLILHLGIGIVYNKAVGKMVTRYSSKVTPEPPQYHLHRIYAYRDLEDKESDDNWTETARGERHVVLFELRRCTRPCQDNDHALGNFTTLFGAA